MQAHQLVPDFDLDCPLREAAVLPLADLAVEKVLRLSTRPAPLERVPPQRLFAEDVSKLVQVVLSPQT